MCATLQIAAGLVDFHVLLMSRDNVRVKLLDCHAVLPSFDRHRIFHDGLPLPFVLLEDAGCAMFRIRIAAFALLLTPMLANAQALFADGFEAVSTEIGAWINVTPANVDLNNSLGCSNYGGAPFVNRAYPSTFYAHFDCQGVWKSTDYGRTWTGPINDGSNADVTKDCAGALTGPTNNSNNAIYLACIRGAATGFWRSLDGGFNWTRYAVTPGGSRQDFYAPAVNPYDPNHLLIAGHEMNVLAQSTDGGQTWTNISMASGMLQNGGTAALVFIDTGNASTTRNTWLYVPQGTGGGIGTWRTSDAGTNWTRVDNNEKPHGGFLMYQPDSSGVIFMPGIYSALGWGVLRSTDYGQTWAHVGPTSAQALVFGTSTRIYTMWGFPIGIGGVVNPSLWVSNQPGTGTWTQPGTPDAMTQGPGSAVVTYDGSHYIIVTGNHNAGLWRYVEP